MKKLPAIMLALTLALSLTACGGGGNSGTDDITTLVKGNIDAIYLGKVTDEYLTLIDSTKAQALQEYQDGLDVEAEYFCYYTGIVESEYSETYDDVSDANKQRIINLYKQIYDKSKYEVSDAVAQSDGDYTCKVVIYPIDIMEQADDVLNSGTYQPYEDFSAKWATAETDGKSDAELDAMYQEFSNDYADVMIGLVESLLPELGYKEPKSMSIQVQKGDDDVYRINTDDWNNIDNNMIYYP